MILSIAHRDGDTVVDNVERTYFIDDDLWVEFRDDRVPLLFEGREPGVKPTIAESWVNNKAFNEYAPEGTEINRSYEELSPLPEGWKQRGWEQEPSPTYWFENGELQVTVGKEKAQMWRVTFGHGHRDPFVNETFSSRGEVFERAREIMADFGPVVIDG